MAKRPGGKLVAGDDASKSQLIPFLGKSIAFRRKAFLIPALVTMATVVFLFNYGRDDPRFFAYAMVIFLGSGAHYVIYRLCGKDRPWRVQAICFGVTAALITLPLHNPGHFQQTGPEAGQPVDFVAHPFDFVSTQPIYFSFHYVYERIIPIKPPDTDQAVAAESWPLLFFQWTINTGIPEELIKIIPLFLIIWALGKQSEEEQARWGISEPLDGILYASVSALSFAIIETTVKYMPQVFELAFLRELILRGMVDPKVLSSTSLEAVLKTLSQTQIAAARHAGSLAMIMNAIPRSLSEIFGHVAYSGYFGYFVGLSVLKPKHRWKLLGIGLASSSILHGLWDSTESFTLEFVIGTASYCALIAAILKARQISPTRALNFATQVARGSGASFGGAPGVAVEFSLRVGATRTPLSRGTVLRSPQLPGLTSRAADGVVAAVSHRPDDREILGLKNCSLETWTGQASSGHSFSVVPGKSVRLERGMTLQMGPSSAVVE
jgi:RsiW-degrading membrane proteinase PrsW (M82 family)